MGEVTVRIAAENGPSRTFGGYGADTDIIMASAKAYLAALNRMLAIKGSQFGQPEGESSAITVAPSAT